MTALQQWTGEVEAVCWSSCWVFSYGWAPGFWFSLWAFLYHGIISSDPCWHWLSSRCSLSCLLSLHLLVTEPVWARMGIWRKQQKIAPLLGSTYLKHTAVYQFNVHDNYMVQQTHLIFSAMCKAWGPELRHPPPSEKDAEPGGLL